MTNKKNKITKGTPKAKPVVNKVVAELHITAQEQTAITATFEEHRHECPETKEEYWTARELMVLLGYSNWQNFMIAITRAMETLEGTGGIVSDHFTDVSKMISLGKGGKRETQDYHLSRYACYLIAQNSDSRKQVIKLAQRYFAVKTRRAEIADAEISDELRIVARAMVAESEVALSLTISKVVGGMRQHAITKNIGDLGLFKMNTAEVKLLMGITKERKNTPLSDVLPLELLYAKCEINTLTVEDFTSGKYTTITGLQESHSTNGTKVRNRLIAQNLTPEHMRPMLLIGSVQGELDTNFSNSVTSVDGYKVYIGDYNVSGYAGVQRTDGMYVGTIYGNVQTEPMETKLLAMQIAASSATDLATNNPGKMIHLQRTVIIPMIATLGKMKREPGMDYLTLGYVTRTLNNLDTTYIAEQIEGKLSIEELHSDTMLQINALSLKGYMVAESFIAGGIVVSIYG